MTTPTKAENPSAWQHIATAPKNGTAILACWNEHDGAPCEVVRWDDVSEEWACMMFGLHPPTHWMPLPPPPSDALLAQRSK